MLKSHLKQDNIVTPHTCKVPVNERKKIVLFCLLGQYEILNSNFLLSGVYFIQHFAFFTNIFVNNDNCFFVFL